MTMRTVYRPMRGLPLASELGDLWPLGRNAAHALVDPLIGFDLIQLE
jgi:hypothetical protein